MRPPRPRNPDRRPVWRNRAVEEPELREILATVRAFVRNVVVPAEDDIEAADEIPAAIKNAAAAMGLYGFAIPAEHGGLGLSLPDRPWARPSLSSGGSVSTTRRTRGTRSCGSRAA